MTFKKAPSAIKGRPTKRRCEATLKPMTPFDFKKHRCSRYARWEVGKEKLCKEHAGITLTNHTTRGDGR